MDKGTLNQIFFRGQTAYRIPKLVTLAVTSCVFLAMISIDASAATSAATSAQDNPNTQLVLGVAQGTVVSAANTPSLGHGSSAPTRSLKFYIRASKSRNNAPVAGKSKSSATLVNHSSGSSAGKRKVSTGTKTGTKPIFGFTPPTTTTTVKFTKPPTTTNNSPTNNPTTTTTTGPTPTTTTTTPTTTTTTSGVSTNTAYPIGTPNSSDQTGYAPPSATALAGYHQSYLTTFTGTSLPADWQLYEGAPQGDAGAQFDRAHVTVSGGLLRINTYQDPNFNNEWVTGGTSLTGIAGQTYGAYFVRSRETAAGDDDDELLWPDANVWPPEIDFNETYGTSTGSNATVHFNAANNQDARTVTIDMTQWHTWGVIWSPTSIIYTVDGNVWGTVTKTAEIPTIPMHISLQSQTFCSAGWACPTVNNSLLVDWVAEYTAN
jgi:hypothetical protein